MIFWVFLLKAATQALHPSFCNCRNSLEKCKFTCGNLYYDIFPLLHSLFLQLQTQQHVHTMITIYFKIRNNKLINSIIFPQFINHLWIFAFRGDNKKHWWWRHLKLSIQPIISKLIIIDISHQYHISIDKHLSTIGDITTPSYKIDILPSDVNKLYIHVISHKKNYRIINKLIFQKWSKNKKLKV